MIYIDGEKIGNEKEVRQLLAGAPGAFRNAFRILLYQERKRYIGNKKKDGKFRKQLLRKRLNGRGPFGRKGTWPKNVAKAFKGYVFNKKTLDNMTLRMGAGLNNPSKFMLGLRKMDEAYKGSRSITSSKQMPIPLYRNIKKVYSGDASTVFKNLSKAGKLQPVNIGNRTFWFHKDLKYKTRGKGDRSKRGKFKKSALMFIGAREVKIKPQFNFEGMLEAEKPKIVNRARRAVKQTVRRLNRGMVRSGDWK